MSYSFLFVCAFACVLQSACSQYLGPPALGVGYGAGGGYGVGGGYYGATPDCGTYGGAGVGDVAVGGELPVTGSTLVAGQVPVLGAVRFAGDLPAAGVVTISGACACGCGAPAPYYY